MIDVSRSLLHNKKDSLSMQILLSRTGARQYNARKQWKFTIGRHMSRIHLVLSLFQLSSRVANLFLASNALCLLVF